VNSNRLDLNLLRVFDAILQTRSVTIAASTLSLTQSAGSGGLNPWRREKRSVIPAIIARQLIQASREIFLQCGPANP
jgi:DNA-binding transcriptional LysR family regulator